MRRSKEKENTDKEEDIETGRDLMKEKKKGSGK